ncbi:MAG: arsenate-mycothiol transferase ArsC [Alphaproteobacteria bacterium]
MTDLPSAVLFACTMNAVRSPMAEAILKHLHGQHIYVDSAGVRAGQLDGFAIEVMEEIGIDISGHKAKTFEDLEDSSYDVVISLSPEAQHKAVEMTRVMACELEFWKTFDPTFVEGNREIRLESYRQVRDQLLARIKEMFPTGGAADV